MVKKVDGLKLSKLQIHVILLFLAKRFAPRVILCSRCEILGQPVIRWYFRFENQACSGNILKDIWTSGSISIREHECGGAGFTVHLGRVRRTLSLKAITLGPSSRNEGLQPICHSSNTQASDNSLNQTK